MVRTICAVLTVCILLCAALPAGAAERVAGKPFTPSELSTLTTRQVLAEDLLALQAGQFEETNVLLGIAFLAVAVMIAVALATV